VNLTVVHGRTDFFINLCIGQSTVAVMSQWLDFEDSSSPADSKMYQRSPNGGTNFTDNSLWTTEFTSNYLQTPNPKKNPLFLTPRLWWVQGSARTILRHVRPWKFLHRPKKTLLHVFQPTQNAARAKKKRNSLAGNRTPASCELFFRMTSRNTDHYTTKDFWVD
jgi:hypothetical protein